jgi:antitoxin (DNA-binding transcriptional repressor) of toxin-antitoxin stability system
VNYDEFNTEYTRVLDEIQRGECGAAALAAHVVRLRKATEGITDPAEKTQISSDLDTLGQMLDVSRLSNDEDVWTITSDALRRATSGEGSTADRIARVEESIAEITAVAERNPTEREALLQSTGTLRTLHSSLKTSLAAELAELDQPVEAGR